MYDQNKNSSNRLKYAISNVSKFENNVFLQFLSDYLVYSTITLLYPKHIQHLSLKRETSFANADIVRD